MLIVVNRIFSPALVDVGAALLGKDCVIARLHTTVHESKQTGDAPLTV
jgi:hypothetical protein